MFLGLMVKNSLKTKVLSLATLKFRMTACKAHSARTNAETRLLYQLYSLVPLILIEAVRGLTQQMQNLESIHQLDTNTMLTLQTHKYQQSHITGFSNRDIFYQSTVITNLCPEQTVSKVLYFFIELIKWKAISTAQATILVMTSQLREKTENLCCMKSLQSRNYGKCFTWT